MGRGADFCWAPLERAGSVALYRQIADRLRAAVLGGGRRLPTERDLADGLSVARVTVRAALDIVQAEGLVSRRPRHGTLVCGDLDGLRAVRRSERCGRPVCVCSARGEGCVASG